MNPKFMLSAIRAKYPQGALVPEVSIPDDYMYQCYLAALPASSQAYYQNKIDPNHINNPDFDLKTAKFVRRIDGLLLHSRQWTALEIKVSRADFFRDTMEKRRVWMEHTHRFVYVTPPGLIQLSEVPEHCGLWEVDNNRRVKVMKRAQINKTPQPFPEHLIRNLFYRLSNFERRK